MFDNIQKAAASSCSGYNGWADGGNLRGSSPWPGGPPGNDEDLRAEVRGLCVLRQRPAGKGIPALQLGLQPNLRGSPHVPWGQPETMKMRSLVRGAELPARRDGSASGQDAGYPQRVLAGEVPGIGAWAEGPLVRQRLAVGRIEHHQ